MLTVSEKEVYAACLHENMAYRFTFTARKMLTPGGVYKGMRPPMRGVSSDQGGEISPEFPSVFADCGLRSLLLPIRFDLLTTWTFM